MSPIGGELSYKPLNHHVCFTDSGRSSLRLFLRNQIGKNKRFLIPDFFCGVIEEILQQEGVIYSFYSIKEDLSIDKSTIDYSSFDVFYMINYFGINHIIDKDDFNDKIVIEDNVFIPDFDNNNRFKNWFSFNSFRKISHLADGSLVKTNLDIDISLIQKRDAPFVALKADGNKLKYTYLDSGTGSEEEFLRSFEEAETEIDSQREIYTISSLSMSMLLKIDESTNQSIIQQRYSELGSRIKSVNNEVVPSFISYFVFNNLEKSQLYSSLRDRNVFLPNFWPKTSTENPLYESLVAIPLFSNYGAVQFEYLKNELLRVI